MSHLLAIAALFAFLLGSGQAEAQGAGATSQSLGFVSETGIPDGDGGMLSLCVLTETRSTFYVNFWRSVRAYVLAPDGCETTAYYTFTADDLATAQATSTIPENIPARPRLSAMQFLGGFWGWALVFAGAVRVLMKRLGAMMARPRKVRLSGFSARALNVMAMAANADATAPANRAAVIRSVLFDLTGEEVPESAVEAVLDEVGSTDDDAEFRQFGSGIGMEDRETLVQAALQVVVADGDISRQQSRFIAGLYDGLGITQAHFDRIVNAAFGQPPEPAE